MTICGSTTIDPTAQIAATAIIDAPFRPLLDGRRVEIDGETSIGAGVWIGAYVTVGRGVRVGKNSILEDFAHVEPDCVIGSGVLVTSRAHLGIGVTVGDDTVVKGHVDDHTQIGVGCRVAGDLIHRQFDPSVPWDDPAAEEPSPIIEDGAFVGWRAVVVGGVNIGKGAYVCAGALVTKDVPAGHVAYGRNQVIHHSAWPGGLAKSPFFRAEPTLA
jgi:acetyltransferase-like isoleucine patch superfamily enzyme